MKTSKKFYITTSIAYVNASPHLGFALESVQADVLARYHRLLNEDVFFLTGTDEHGRKVVQAAQTEKMAVKKFADKITSQFQKLVKDLNISSDFFIRTTDKKNHWLNVKKIWQRLVKAGDIYIKQYKGLYCLGHEAFITKKELKNGLCSIHQQKPELIEEENYFFRLSKYSKEMELRIRNRELRIIPESRKKEMLNFIKKGLEDISFSRPSKDLKWGIPVPNDPTQTVYVWADALANYLFPQKYWPADVHIIGKDILRFHALIWPAMLLSVNLPLPKTIFVHGFITVNKQKMSKTLGNVIDPFKLIKNYGSDAVRYYLLREIPPTGDGDFSYEKFKERYNADLVKGLGNLEARMRGIIIKYQIANTKYQILNKDFDAKIKYTWKKYHRALNNFQFNEALKMIWALISFCDKYIDRTKPWKIKERGKLETILSNLIFSLLNIAWLLEPFLPQTANKIFRQLGLNKKEGKAWRNIKIKIKKAKNLFPPVI